MTFQGWKVSLESILASKSNAKSFQLILCNWKIRHCVALQHVEIDYASQVKTKWPRKEKKMVQATTSAEVFSQGKAEPVWFRKVNGE